MSADTRCERCGSPLEVHDLRCAVCAWPSPAQAHGQTGVPATRVLRCDACGAAVEYAADTGAPRCGFCGAVTRLEELVDPLEQAESFLPFRVDAEGARRALSAWLSSLGWFRPSDLVTGATVQLLRPLWWVGWLVDATVEASWTADSDSGARYAAWAPHAGTCPLSFSRMLIPATRGLSMAECQQLAPRFDMALDGAERSGPDDAIVEQFDVQRSGARLMVMDIIRRQAADIVTRQAIPGTRFRNLHVEVLLQGLTTRRVALPTYVMAYSYKKRQYRVLVHGQDVSGVFGSAPYSLTKIAAVAATSLGALGVAAIIALNSGGDETDRQPTATTTSNATVATQTPDAGALVDAGGVAVGTAPAPGDAGTAPSLQWCAAGLRRGETLCGGSPPRATPRTRWWCFDGAVGSAGTVATCAVNARVCNAARASTGLNGTSACVARRAITLPTARGTQ